MVAKFRRFDKKNMASTRKSILYEHENSMEDVTR